MKNKKIFTNIILLICLMLFTSSLTACIESNPDVGEDKKTITISLVENNVEIGTSIILDKEANFQPVYQKNIKYEFVGENECNATFTHTLNNNWWTTHITASLPGTVSIKISYMDGDNVICESNIVTLTFFANTINTIEELKNLAYSEKSYVLGANIDLSSEKNWEPINGFKGTLSGDGYSICNLTINSVNDTNLGLFGTLEGTVENLLIENAQVTSRGDAGNAGIIAGTNNGVIKNVIVNGSVVANYYDNVGGIAGLNNNGIISNCENQASIAGNDNVGGIVGLNKVNGDDKANGNINNGEVTGKNNVGGVFGCLTSAPVKTDNAFIYKIENNENNSEVNGKENVGGVIGKVIGAERNDATWSTGLGYFAISVVSNNGEVIASGDCVGGLIGYGKRLSELTVSTNNANVTGYNYVGGYIGKSSNTTIRVAENNSIITGRGYVGGIAGYAGKIENATNNGDVISTAVIVEDGESRSYVGGIAGYCTALNNSKNFANISIDNAGSYIGGLVGYLYVNGNDQVNGNENSGNVQGNDSVGGIAGYLTMQRVKTDYDFNYSFAGNVNNGIINGTNDVGGIIGHLVGAERNDASWSTGLGYFDVSACDNNAEVNATGNNVGGIVGNAIRLATMTVCTNNADISGSNYVGGYVGNGKGANIKLATTNNIISGKAYVGGIAGYAGVVENSTNNGVVNSNGVIVENSTPMSYVGGIAGYCTGLLNCTNNSDIDVSIYNGGQYVGGLAGYILISSDNQIDGNENYGTVSGSKYTGGIVGYLDSQALKKDNNYTRSTGINKNFGSVYGTDYVGGIFGYVYGAGKYSSYYSGVCHIIITYCENEAEVFGISYVGGIVGGYTRVDTNPDIIDTNKTLYGSILGQE